PAGSAKPKSTPWPKLLATTLSAPGPWVVALSFCVYAGQWTSVIGFLPSVYAEAGIAGGTAGVLTAFAAVVNMVGGAGSGRLIAMGFRPQTLMTTGFAVMGVAAIVAFADFGG